MHVMKNEEIIESLKIYFPKEDCTNFEIGDFVSAFGSPLLAIAYSKLFWPEFVEFEGMVFLAEAFDNEAQQRVSEALKQNIESKSEIEEAFNLYEVPSYFFGTNAGDTTEDEDHELAKIMAEMWMAKLRMDFPNKAFKMEIVPPEVSGGEVSLLFYQEEI